MSKIQLPPKKTPEILKEEKAAQRISEKKIKEIINKGGSPIQVDQPVNDKVKNFNIMILESDLDMIGELCDKRPKKPGRIIGFSKKDWLLEAIQEKLAREKKKNNL
ncbi:MAG: hypothetical protein EOO92_06810 [Pedobacter sp.]|nr:MAG: hypothetical protein EOO92_06810 [Pedobacter sp.]